MPLPFSADVGLERLRGGSAVAGSAPPLFWLDPLLNSRLPISATNSSGATITDALVTATIPGGVTIDTVSLRAVEATASGLEQPNAWRYGTGTNINRMPLLPVSVSGSTLTVKALGDWATGTTRTFHIYWSSRSGYAARAITHLAVGATTPYVLTKRSGPDTEGSAQFNGENAYGPVIDRTLGHSQLAGRWGMGAGQGTSQQIRILKYDVQGDGSSYGLATLASTQVVDGPTITLTGTLQGETRSAGRDWDATLSMVHQNRLLFRPKADGTLAGTIAKNVELYRVQMVISCARAYTPQTTGTDKTTFTAQYVLALATTDNSFAGNTTTPAGERLPYFYSLSGTTFAELVTNHENENQPLAGQIIGAAGNSNCFAILLNSVSLANFGAQATVSVGVWSGAVYLYGLSNASQVPIGATITVDFWYAHHRTPSPIADGTNLLPSEMVAFLRTAATSPAATVGAMERYTEASLVPSVKQASEDAARGCQWFADNALTYTGNATNSAYQVHIPSGVVGVSDDDDGSYGEGHKLHGLCLRYLRTHDAALVAQINRQVQFHLTIEIDAVASYGSWWLGSTPYWRWPTVAPSGSVNEHGIAVGGTDPTDGSSGTFTYSQGQVRRLVSIDQMHMVAHGLYAYLYLLRNEAAITANTTLRANTLAFLGRMATFEAAHWDADARSTGNLNRICNGLTPLTSNGITVSYLNTLTPQALPTPYNGDVWKFWQLDNIDDIAADPSINSAVDYFFRGVYAPDSTVAGVKKFLTGRIQDALILDHGLHDVVRTDATWGVIAGYPPGWGGKGSATGNDLLYSAGRDGDKHYIQADAGGFGARDAITGRHSQRFAMMCILALIDPTVMISIEAAPSGVPLRARTIANLCDITARTMANYLTESVSGATHWSVSRWLGGSSDKIVDSAFTGYWLMGAELYLALKAGQTYLDLYPIGTW